MLTGDLRVTSGDFWIRGRLIKLENLQMYKDVGYCPQFDAMFDDLTGEETLKFFCMLRGVPWRFIEQLSKALAKELNFIDHFLKIVNSYSGGNKRKLSTAVALLGSPSVIYLDEPTTGMDPGAKRHLWMVLSRYREAGKTIILTSHSMEECDALCTRLAIMVNGEFKCLGSTQHLKTKFSGGYSLVVLIKKQWRNRTQALIIESYVKSRFQDASLK